MSGAAGVWLRLARQILFVAFLLAIVAFAGTPSAIAQALAVGGTGIAFAHGARVYGLSGIFLFLVICLAVTFAMENLSIATGFPFGHYHFEVAAALPYIGAVPIVVGLLYFAMGYFSWMIAGLLLDDADFHLDRPLNVVALPIIASFVMVQWDVVMDPPNATLHRAWIWHDGGGYFGVPLSNYAGWYLTVWLFYQAFAVVVYCRPSWAAPRPGFSRLLPVLLYLAVGLSYAVPYLNRPRGRNRRRRRPRLENARPARNHNGRDAVHHAVYLCACLIALGRAGRDCGRAISLLSAENGGFSRSTACQ